MDLSLWIFAFGHPILNESNHLNLQSACEPLDVINRHVLFSSLDSTNVGPVEAGSLRQIFLR